MSELSLGIDFGTTTSSMAWVDPATGRARIIKNEEGEERTPSVVWFDSNNVLVGRDAETEIKDNGDWARAFTSVKRDLRGIRMVPGRGQVRAVEVVAAILRKLKTDAEKLHFRQSVPHAVIACPAAFAETERDIIRDAGLRAGFTSVTLVEEPVAAGLAYLREGLKVGERLLVYDLGGGTFDLAVLTRDGNSFRLAMPPRGLRRCGGDDFDRVLYDWLDAEAVRRLGRSFDTEGGTDLRALWGCRDCKERLSQKDAYNFRLYLQGTRFEHGIDRAAFEALITEVVDRTATETRAMLDDAARAAIPVDSVVLIGGGAKVPLIARRLADILPLPPQRWDQQDVAVALGTAYWATSPSPPPSPDPADWLEREMARELGISPTNDSDLLAGLAREMFL